MQTPLEYLEKHFHEFLDDLKDLIRIPSISFPPYPTQALKDCASLCKEMLLEAGLKKVTVIEEIGKGPYVLGEWFEGKDLPTLLLYAHHDVQPPMREELWETSPFQPTMKDERLFGRGAADDKAGVILHIASICCYLKTLGSLPFNLKVLFEGEEEIGSPNLPQFIEKYEEALKCDALLIADLSLLAKNTPTITCSLRGLVSLDIELKTLRSPLHSGLWGGPVPDVTTALAKVIASLTDSQGQIKVPPIVESIPSLEEDEIALLRQVPLSRRDLVEQAGLIDSCHLLPEQSNPFETLWYKPSLSIHHFLSGDEKATGNVIMDRAKARIGIRVPPGMDEEKLLKDLKTYICKQVPWGIECLLEESVTVPGWKISPSHPLVKMGQETLEEGYQSPSYLAGCGATIPFVNELTTKLGQIPALLTAVEDPQSKAHSENESVDTHDLYKSIKSQILFFEQFKEYRPH